MFSNGVIFFVDLVLPYLIFKISYANFPVKLSTHEYATHHNEQFGGGPITIS